MRKEVCCPKCGKPLNICLDTATGELEAVCWTDECNFGLLKDEQFILKSPQLELLFYKRYYQESNATR